MKKTLAIMLALMVMCGSFAMAASEPATLSNPYQTSDCNVRGIVCHSCGGNCYLSSTSYGSWYEDYHYYDTEEHCHVTVYKRENIQHWMCSECGIHMPVSYTQTKVDKQY